ncbi:MAG: bifunctional aspartate kinase/diaminopimelate decarboxylase [Pseudomonadota bacterium]
MGNNIKDTSWVVLKFGGTSVSTLKNWQIIKSIIEARLKEGKRPLVVCSAFAGISNLLEKLLETASKGAHADVFCEIQGRHRQIASELDVDLKTVEPYFDELSKLVTGISLTREASPRLRAQVLSYGELLSTRICSAYLAANSVSVAWRDARDFLLSVDVSEASQSQKYLVARCECNLDEILKEQLNAITEQVVLTQGFIARDNDGDTVLLGRGGSDVSAAYFASKLGASRCEIWTDVPGMFTANPNQIPRARLLKTLTYEEAQELASAGAKVLHPRCIAPVRKQSIPLYIYSFTHPDLEGTVISADAQKSGAQVKAISARHGVTLISMETVEMWHQVGFLARVFDCFKKHNLSIDLVSTSETNVTVTLDRAQNSLEPSAMKVLKSDLEKFCQVRSIESCALISLLGRNIRAILHKIAPALEVFEEQKIYLVTQAANDLNFTFVVDEEQADKLVSELHSELFSRRSDDNVLGPTWLELNAKPEDEKDKTHLPWWKKRRAELIDLAKNTSPLYVYDEETILKRASALTALSSVDKVFYSVKANAHPEILAALYESGLGFECVSPGEIDHVMRTFPHIDAQRILFTPNFAPRKEYEHGFEKGVNVTLDNLYPLEKWPEVFRNKEIFVRIDPGEGEGHHKFVKTAGAKSKFGVSVLQLDELSNLLEKCGAKVIGLHAHAGSNIFTPDKWSSTATFLASVAKRFPDVRYLDVGGGLGVVEKPGQTPLDLDEVDENLKKVKQAHPQYKLWIEPGRYLVATAGVLLAKVTQTKQKGEYRYIGVDAGMNTFIRPMLYGSFHEIVNLSRLGEKSSGLANIVGPICETGDVLGHERAIADPTDGDVLLIATTGAYGRVMSSEYNLRPPAAEHFLCCAK